MNWLNKILILILVFNLYKLNAQDCKSNINIVTNDPHSVIFVNNRITGNGEARLKLKNGTYIISVIRDSLKWNSQAFADTLDLDSCIDKNLTYNFEPQVYLRTDPEDAYVFYGDSLIGHTPLFLSYDFENLKLMKKGYSEKTISLRKISTAKPVQLKYNGEVYGKSFYQTPVFKYLIGGIVLLGATTAYFKIKADDKFEQYQLSGDGNLLSDTRKYDLISGIAFGALQINFGILIYYFLTD